MANANTQKELRRISLNRRTKIEAAKSSTEKITSPLAKYDLLGNLHCVICKSIVKSANIWKVHINSANHKRNVELAKQLKDDILKAKPLTPATKSIMKSTEPSKTATIKPTVVTEKKESEPNSKIFDCKTESVAPDAKPQIEEILPENFFDVVKDSEKEKEAFDDEWQKFKKEIIEESNVSHVIEASDHDHVAHDRQLEEIDEQMLCWYKVRTMEEKKEKIQKTLTKRQPQIDESDESDNMEGVDEFPDWRCKKYKNNK